MAAYEANTDCSSVGAGIARRRTQGARASASCSAERSARNTPGDSIGSMKPKASPIITQPLLERNAPAPARIAARDPDLTGRVVPAEALEVREVRDVLPGPEAPRNPEHAGREACASGG